MSEPYRQPSGWYPQGTVYRYWDGSGWTEHTAPITQDLPPDIAAATPSAAAPAPAYDAMPAPPRFYPPPPPPSYGYVAPKSPGLALLASFFIPGLGTMINGEVGKGVGILVGYIVSCILVVVVIGLAGMLGFWIWGMVDAYRGAQRWNARHGILS